ncbi:MAG: hypothetical protein JWO37_743 [Acidimicrobiales bacterium]|nr:hypothetical protein [Acidimicrobiales bacterium]
MDEQAWKLLIYRALNMPDAIADKARVAAMRIEELAWPAPGSESAPEAARINAAEFAVPAISTCAAASNIDDLLMGWKTTDECIAAMDATLNVERRQAGIDFDLFQVVATIVLDAVKAWVDEHPVMRWRGPR